MFSRRPPATTCFFCLSVQNPAPRDARAFQCTECQTWNRYSKAGEIMSDEAAMHDASMNTSSFAKRGSASKTSLPSQFSSSVFCRSCQTNQMLLLNLMSNYLPEPEDPCYDSLVEQLPAYQESLHQRYPPVCKDCQGTVDEQLKSKQYMARTAALGARLKQTKRLEAERIAKPDLPRDVVVWRVRGALWVTSELYTLLLFTLGTLDRLDAVYVPSPAVAIAFLLLSVSWMFWDPTWFTMRKARLSGQRIRVNGRQQYIRYQIAAWVERFIAFGLALARSRSIIWVDRPRPLFAVGLIIELSCLALSYLSLSIQRPTPIRLIDTKSLRQGHEQAAPAPAAPPQLEADPEPLLSALSLASQPIILKPSSNPIFGQPSFPQGPSTTTNPDDEMDWTPTGPGAALPVSESDWLAPQRFFAPEQPTGLEALLERTSLKEEDQVMSDEQQQQQQKRSTGEGLSKHLVYLGIILVLLALLWNASITREPSFVRPSLRSERVSRMPSTEYAQRRREMYERAEARRR
ncbi:hypothetical protein AURDEDRAFT_184695 [Auricularia subglabra TFB-10046 SS5]|nr:hypothetical protein AURDEDRAFT_184695 [Auricularia subglabra TFB-10046 SS5]